MTAVTAVIHCVNIVSDIVSGVCLCDGRWGYGGKNGYGGRATASQI